MRDLKSELEVKEAKHFKRKAGDVFEGERIRMCLSRQIRCWPTTANDPAIGRACCLGRSTVARLHKHQHELLLYAVQRRGNGT